MAVALVASAAVVLPVAVALAASVEVLPVAVDHLVVGSYKKREQVRFFNEFVLFFY